MGGGDQIKCPVRGWASFEYSPGNCSLANAVTRVKSTTGEASALCSHPTGGDAGGEMRNCWVLLGMARVGEPIRMGYQHKRHQYT